MSSVVPPFVPPPPGFNYIPSLEPSFTFVLISLPFASILVPVFLLILFFSTPNSRKTLLFALNIIIVLLGIVEGVLSTIVQSIVILHPEYPVPDHLFLSYIGIALYTPIVVDCILILRLSAVYPASVTSYASRIPILSVPLLCTVARIICVSFFVHQWAALGSQSTAELASIVVWPRNPMIIADWTIQLFENFYCSSLFLIRLRDHKVLFSRMYRQQSVAARLRAIFYIAISNFCFPALLSVFQLIFVIHDHVVAHGALVLMVNNYISIIGVVFCTLWSSGDVWKEARKYGSQFGSNYQEAAFRQSVITLSGIAPNLNTSPTGPVSSPTLAHTSRQSASHGFQLSRVLHYKEGRKDVDVESGLSLSRNFSRNLNGGTSDPYLETLTLPRIPGDADLDLSADSHSPITPHDVRGIISGKKERSERRWEAAITAPRDSRSLRGESHLDVGSSLSELDLDLDLDFTTTPLPPLPRRYERPSLSISDSSDYHSRDVPRHRDIGDISVPPVPVEVEDLEDHNGRSSRGPSPSSENDGHSGPFVNDDPSSRSRANRPSCLDWSDARPGGGVTPSWDGCSHSES